MVKLGAAIVGLCAAVALGACGGSDGSKVDSLGGANWTLTFTSPAHGQLVSSPAFVEVAITGRAAVEGQEPDFDLAFFAGEELIEQTRETSLEVELPLGQHHLRVVGVDANGQVLDDVLGDELVIDVRKSFEPGITIHFPEGFENIEIQGVPRGRLDAPRVTAPEFIGTDIDVELPEL